MAVLKKTNPYPLDRPLSFLLRRFTFLMFPKLEKYLRRSLSVMLKERPPTKRVLLFCN